MPPKGWRRKKEPATDTSASGERRPSGRGQPIWPAGLTKAKVRAVCAAGYAIIDGGLAEANRFQPGIWVTPEDRLTEEELALLSTATADELARHPRIVRYIDRFVRLFQHAGLAGALLLVALPRLERRGLVPPFVSVIFAALSRAEQEAAATPEPEISRTPGTEERPPDREAA